MDTAGQGKPSRKPIAGIAGGCRVPRAVGGYAVAVADETLAPCGGGNRGRQPRRLVRQQQGDARAAPPRHGGRIVCSFRLDGGKGVRGRRSRAVSCYLLDYTVPSTPRQRASGSIYTSTEYPAEYHAFRCTTRCCVCPRWPLKIGSYCELTPGGQGRPCRQPGGHGE